MSERIEEFMRRRARETGDLAREAYERGREEWNKATRAGRALTAARPSDVVAVGREVIEAGGRQLDSTLGNSRAARTAAGVAGWSAGLPVGAGRAVVHAAKDLGTGAVYVERMVNPNDPLHYATQIATVDGVTDAAKRGAAYVADRAVHPEHLRADVRQGAHHLNESLNPFATPLGAAPSEAFARKFRVGMNDGEVAANVAALATGAGESRAIARLAGASEAMTAEKLAKLSYGPAETAYLAEPYGGMGSHFPISRAVGKKLGLPQWVIDSPLNVSKPNVSRYDFMKEHYEADPAYHGGPIRGRRGRGSGFSGEKAGFQRREGLDRLWRGMPAATKAVAGGVLGAPIGYFQIEEGDEP